jgi:hypothetical protein
MKMVDTNFNCMNVRRTANGGNPGARIACLAGYHGKYGGGRALRLHTPTPFTPSHLSGRLLSRLANGQNLLTFDHR